MWRAFNLGHQWYVALYEEGKIVRRTEERMPDEATARARAKELNR